MATINDDILLRIIEVSKDKIVGIYHPKDIRIHCKNYFDHITCSWNDNLSAPFNTLFAQNLIQKGGYLTAAKDVLIMLEQTQMLLLKNSKETFPR